MGEIDLYHYKHRYECMVENVKESDLSVRNKELILEFVGDCKIGWGGKKLTLPRLIKYLFGLKDLMQMLGKDFDYISKKDVKRLLCEIDGNPRWGDWSQRDYRILLRKFVSWLREEHGYPKDYPNAAYLTKILPLLPYPEEVRKIKISFIDKQKPREEIPTQEEMKYLRMAAINFRDKAYFAVSEELGPRIGGIGTRQLKHVVFDELGAKIYMHDKTMKGEPVQLVWSASYLREWWESHPFRDNPEAPLWVQLTKDTPVPLDYGGFRRMIIRTVDRHNKRAKTNGLPLITRRIHTHGFRYFAQIRDDVFDGIPRSVQKKQRGWAPGSKMPDKYAAIVNKDVEDFFKEKYGMTAKEKKEKPKICPRCREVNAVGSLFCRRCGMPMNEEAKKYDDAIDTLVDKLILDPELSQRLREKMLEVGDNHA